MGAATIAIALALTAAPMETPADAVVLAAQDLGRMPEKDRYLYRYFWAGHLGLKERRELWQVLGGHCNQLSTQPDRVPMQLLPGETVARVNLIDYGWTAETWEKLLEVEPYFHLRVSKDGKATSIQGPWLRQAVVEEAANEPGRKRLVRGPGGQSLDLLTGYTTSQVPMVRADWFHWQTGQQADRNPGYYDFIGIGNEGTFDKLVGFDNEVLKRFPIHAREAIGESTVTLQPRRLERFGKIGGALWATSDVRQATDKSNPLQVLDSSFKHDARESIAHLPNGFLAWGLFDGNGKRVDSAPDFIASDATSHSTDRRVHVGVSCIRCHGPHLGFQPIDGWVRGLYRKPLSLQSPDYATAKGLNRLYFSKLEPLLDADRLIYQNAVQEATGGMGVKEWSKAYGDQFARYDSSVTLERAAADYGMEPKAFQDALRQKGANSQDIDPAMGTWLAEKPRRLPIAVYHQQHGAIQVLLKGY